MNCSRSYIKHQILYRPNIIDIILKISSTMISTGSVLLKDDSCLFPCLDCGCTVVSVNRDSAYIRLVSQNEVYILDHVLSLLKQHIQRCLLNHLKEEFLAKQLKQLCEDMFKTDPWHLWVVFNNTYLLI